MPQGKSIEVKTIEELFKESTSGSIPILCDVQHDGIYWNDGELEQENGHLRLINSSTPIIYNGHRYLPSNFSFTMPSEDGKKIGNTSITISAIDKRIIEVIRSINENPPKLIIEAFFSKTTLNDHEVYMFSKLYHYEFQMNTVSWDSVTAKWNLLYDPVMQLNVPVDKATKTRCPSVNEGR